MLVTEESPLTGHNIVLVPKLELHRNVQEGRGVGGLFPLPHRKERVRERGLGRKRVAVHLLEGRVSSFPF